MGRIEACCQSSRPTIFNSLESGDVDTITLLGWRSGCLIRKWRRAELLKLETSDGVAFEILGVVRRWLFLVLESLPSFTPERY